LEAHKMHKDDPRIHNLPRQSSLAASKGKP